MASYVQICVDIVPCVTTPSDRQYLSYRVHIVCSGTPVMSVLLGRERIPLLEGCKCYGIWG